MPSDLTQEPLIWKDGGLGGGCHRVSTGSAQVLIVAPTLLLGLRATPPCWAIEKCSREGLHEELLQQVFPSEQGSGGAEPVAKTVSRNTAPRASGGSKEA